jgi:hypothetical protein
MLGRPRHDTVRRIVPCGTYPTQYRVMNRPNIGILSIALQVVRRRSDHVAQLQSQFLKAPGQAGRPRTMHSKNDDGLYMR